MTAMTHATRLGCAALFPLREEVSAAVEEARARRWRKVVAAAELLAVAALVAGFLS